MYRLRVAALLLAGAWLLAGCARPREHERDASARSRRYAATPRDRFHHTVQRGETLSGIARRYGVSTRALARDNAIANVDHIEAGQKVFIRARSKTEESREAPTRTAQATADTSTSLTRTHSVRGTGRLAWPLKGTVARRYGGSVGGGPARGIAIRAARGAAVKAADNGLVVVCCEHMRGYGKVVVLDHGNGLITVYANNDTLLVRPGESVRKGQSIARVGSTGRAARSQLEFRVYRWGLPQDPLRYLR